MYYGGRDTSIFLVGSTLFLFIFLFVLGKQIRWYFASAPAQATITRVEDVPCKVSNRTGCYDIYFDYVYKNIPYSSVSRDAGLSQTIYKWSRPHAGDIEKIRVKISDPKDCKNVLGLFLSTSVFTLGTILCILVFYPTARGITRFFSYLNSRR